MNAEAIWESFREKLISGTLVENDFDDSMKCFLVPFLVGDNNISRRKKYAYAPAEFFDSEYRAVVTLSCPDDNYRFDFIRSGESYKLMFIECVTLPMSDLCPLPYSAFTPLPEKETEIRSEKEMSRMVRLYLKFKELLGKDEAVKMFFDGAGETLAARSWVPFYDDRRAFVAYATWIESRINGEKVSLEEFSQETCVLRFIDHLWRKIYAMTGHLKTQIGYDEYMNLFEAIWTDRAEKAGWEISIDYEERDTVLTLKKRTAENSI